MAQHVLGVLDSIEAIDRVVLLSPSKPDWWAGDWSQDRADGLNRALTGWKAANGSGALLVIHGDLPFLDKANVVHLIEAAQLNGMAMATDRDGTGTNAIALAAGKTVQFCFGPGSRMAHEMQRGMTVIQPAGMARDIDNPTDLVELRGTAFDKSKATAGLG